MAEFDDRFSNGLSQGHSFALDRLSCSMKAYIIANVAAILRRTIIVITEDGSTLLTQNIQFFVPEAVELLSCEDEPERIEARRCVLQKIEQKKAPIIIGSLQTLSQKVVSHQSIEQASLKISVGDELPFDLVVQQCAFLGYTRVPVATNIGEMAVRGGIIDLFCVSLHKPVRIEFLGDEVASIRQYDPSSQRSSVAQTSITLTPLSEKALTSETSHTLLEMCPDSYIVIDEIEKFEEQYIWLLSQKQFDIKTWLKQLFQKQILYIHENTLEKLSHVRAVTIGSHTGVAFSLCDMEVCAIRALHPFMELPDFYETICLCHRPQKDELIACCIQASSIEHTFVVQSSIEQLWLKKKFEQQGGVFPEHAVVREGFLSSGFARVDTQKVFFAMADVVSRTFVPRKEERPLFAMNYDGFDIEPGDYVVHFNHGLGRYLGVESKQNAQGQMQEFFCIEYAQNSRVYVPIAQSHLINKYIGSSDDAPTVSVLGSSRWKKIREETERSIVGYAATLLQHQAQRVSHGGFACPDDSEQMMLFEAEFPYTATNDQMSAITDVKKDMCSLKAMDRLICGDVGYGKTEVAMRAAAKAVIDGKKQVAFLVPTTILAMQHYETLQARMAPFGVRIGIVSRFSTTKQNKATVAALQNGDIDVIVGTHRLLQKDIAFRDLGLIIIDEEQRFGVKAKEQLKCFKEGVDCLTLSATPIPRTLYLSLISAKDLSTINTPPYDRLPVKTFVGEMTEEGIRTALVRELQRGGQSFYVHNRVETIFEKANALKTLVGHASIAVVHGQMSSDEIDTVFHKFSQGKIDILVATSIIENGIDVPNANTIIVERADCFGIADLYQIKGRVGRWNKRAFAYFLVPAIGSLPDIARKRIEAIAQAGGYGGGMKVAMRDLEIRGAGNLLGTEQSGQVASIGFLLYCKLLKRAIDTMSGKSPAALVETKVDVPFDAKLPEYYINELSLRLEIYQRLGEAVSVEEIEHIVEEIVDRFGAMPEAALWLVSIAKTRVLAGLHGYTLVKLDPHSIYIERKIVDGCHQNRVLRVIKTPEQFFKAMQEIVSS